MATVNSLNGIGNQPSYTATPEKYITIGELLEHNAPDNRDLLIKTYGDQGITGFLKLTGAITSGGTADHVQYWEEERRHKLFTVPTVTSSTGTPHVATLDGVGLADIEAQTVVMNASSGEVFICTTAATVFTKLDAGAGTAWVAGDSLIILGNMYDQGTDQPTKFMVTSPTLRKNPYMIVKDTFHVNGSQATNVGWVNIGNGDYRWYLNGEQETRKRFMDKREMMMLFAEKTGADSSTISSNPGDVAGSEGYFAAVSNRGINVSNANAAPLDSFIEFDNIIIELDKQGAPSEYAMYVNRSQSLAIDDMLAAGISTNLTAGLAGQFGAFNNDADMAVQLGFKSFTRGGYTFHKHDWKLLNDPTLVGASNKYLGAMVPMSQVVDPKTGTKAPALEMNFKTSNGYSREMEHWVTGGGVMGYATDGQDVAKFNYRSEICLVTRAANQHVIIKG